MFNWEDREYVNARKKVFKNLDTNEILNLELQDDPDNISKDSQTPLIAHNLNLAQQELLEDIHEYRLIATTAISAGANITIPCYYKVGAGVLDVYFRGERLLLSSDDAGTDGHYCEVGTTGEISNIIKTTTDWSVSVGDYFDFVVRGEYSETE